MGFLSFISDHNRTALDKAGLSKYTTLYGQYLAFDGNEDELFNYVETEWGGQFSPAERIKLVYLLKDTHNTMTSLKDHSLDFISPTTKAALDQSGLGKYSALFGQYLAYECNHKLLFLYLATEWGVRFKIKEKHQLETLLLNTCAEVINLFQ